MELLKGVERCFKLDCIKNDDIRELLDVFNLKKQIIIRKDN